MKGKERKVGSCDWAGALDAELLMYGIKSLAVRTNYSDELTITAMLRSSFVSNNTLKFANENTPEQKESMGKSTWSVLPRQWVARMRHGW